VVCCVAVWCVLWSDGLGVGHVSVGPHTPSCICIHSAMQGCCFSPAGICSRRDGSAARRGRHITGTAGCVSATGERAVHCCRWEPHPRRGTRTSAHTNQPLLLGTARLAASG
jgi:hypothetical protein